ncbi:hypothetical protein [Anaeromyxobacter oryzae]|uniref:Uncharacterized protein n=1 Tax=Anaeromyxobacter oryzae TaxID=2918170 RepID=A0ABM7WP55_9BACT|nr:hypothetical protein [Anaeromyxobacter oryzae]BDG01242.1 hypothetical protein AMOR_02380 [Anaeromyxobacter oryzae]
MPSDAADLLQRYRAAARAPPAPGAPPDAAEAWQRIERGAGRLGAARVRDSARRGWLVEAHRDDRRGRFLVVRPAHGDNEPFRASADGYLPDSYLPVSGTDWSVLALLGAGHDGDDGREDDALRTAAFRIVDRMVVEAQHRLLMGAAEDEDED